MNVSHEEVALSIIRFLNEELSSPVLSTDSKESLEVAIECIQKVYEIQEQDYHKSADIPNLISRSKSMFNPNLANTYRTEGNNLMQDKKYTEALEAYDKSVQYDPSNHVHYANRAAAYLKLERYLNAADDAQFSINLNPSFHKGHARKGIALMGLGDYANAQVSLERALQLDPDNAIYKERIETCKSKITPSGATNPLNVPGLESLLTNPAVMNMAQNLMEAPQFRQMFAGIAENIQGDFDFAGMMQGFESTMNQMRNDPNFMDNRRDQPDEEDPNTQQ